MVVQEKFPLRLDFQTDFHLSAFTISSATGMDSTVNEAILV